MYLNEIAWKEEQSNEYIIIDALEEFLKICKELEGERYSEKLFVPNGMTIDVGTNSALFHKVLNKIDADCRRLLFRIWDKRNTYNLEEDCEFLYQGQRIDGATEAYIHRSFVISLGLSEKWKKDTLEGRLFSLEKDEEEAAVPNVYSVESTHNDKIQTIITLYRKKAIYSYSELWKQRELLFPHLIFCPSVEKDIEKLQVSYLPQILKKLYELDEYCLKHAGKPFDKTCLSKITPESEATLKKYELQHTFLDPYNKKYIASWHMRFTGIPGRIFFVPDYQENKILICYIGGKLPNVTFQ